MIRPMQESQKSEKPFDLNSDSEPPQDMPRQRKLIVSDQRLKIHKEIIRVGSGLDKPAKYDLITYRSEKMDDELTFQFSEGVEFQTRNLGLGGRGGVEDDLLTHIRKGECSLFTVQHRSEKDRKVIDSTEAFLIQVKDWVTVIDLDGDLLWFKTILVRGEGLNRCGPLDLLKIRAEVSRGGSPLFSFVGELCLGDPSSPIPKSAEKVLTNMKQGEKCEVRVKQSVVRQNEGDSQFGAGLSSQSEAELVIGLEVERLTKVFDLFDNGKALRHVLSPGQSQLQPIKSNQVHFRLVISADQLATTLEHKCFIDQRKVSKLLKRILLRSKEKEASRTVCFDNKLIDRGVDKEALLALCNPLPPKVTYECTLLGIVGGRPSYSLDLGQKLQQSRRTKQIAVQLLSQNNFKKALKLFYNNAKAFEYEKERTPEMTQDYISSMLNLSLCHLKLGQFALLVEVCDKILEVAPGQEKALRRKAYALEAQKEYEQCLRVIEEGLGLGLELEESRTRVKALLAGDRRRQSRLYGRMFSEE